MPIVVFDASVYDETEASGAERASRTLAPKVAKLFATVHEALQVLGLAYDQYTLLYGDHFHVLVCEEATLYSEQSCTHGDLGEITDMRNFVLDLHDRESPPRGTVQLNVVILEDGLAWSGLLGVATWWYWGDRSLRHWTSTACRAWALLSTPVIAHELGHCFGLDHNEDDTDIGLDLMVSYYAHFDWVKESNKDLVLRYFRYPAPYDSPTGAVPTMELHY